MKEIVILLLFILLLFSCNNNEVEVNNKISTDSIQNYDSILNVSKSPEKVLSYKLYCNQIYEYCIDYPFELLIPQGESDSRDGQIFKSRNTENTLWVYRDFRDKIYQKPKYTLELAYNEDCLGNGPNKPKKLIRFKKIDKDYFVIYGYNNGKIFYQKSIFKKGQLITCLIEYNEQDSNLYKIISERIFSSFK